MNNNGDHPENPQDIRNNQISNPTLVDWSQGITPEQYQQNQARILELQRMNEMGLRAFAQMEYDKIREAARRLHELEQVTGRTITTGYSEPVQSPPAILGQQQQYGFHNQRVFSSTSQYATTPMQGTYANFGEGQQTIQHYEAQAAYYRSHVSEQRPTSSLAPQRPAEVSTAPQMSQNWSYGAQPPLQGQSSRAPPEQTHAWGAYQIPAQYTTRPSSSNISNTAENGQPQPPAKATASQDQFISTSAQVHQATQSFTTNAMVASQQQASTSNAPATLQQQALTADTGIAQQQPSTSGILPVPDWAKNEYDKWVRLYGAKTADALLREVKVRLQQKAAGQRAGRKGYQSTPNANATSATLSTARSSELAPGQATPQHLEVTIPPSEPSSMKQTRGTDAILTSTVPAISTLRTGQPRPPNVPRPPKPVAFASRTASFAALSQRQQGSASGINAALAPSATQTASTAPAQASTPISQLSVTPIPVPTPAQSEVRWHAPVGVQHYQGANSQGGSARASGPPHTYPTQPYGAHLGPPSAAGSAPAMGQFAPYVPYGQHFHVPPPTQQGWRRSRPELPQATATPASTSSKPTTPVPKGAVAAGIPTSPHSARKPTLARDILRSLGGMSALQQSLKTSSPAVGEKRKRTHGDVPVPEEPPAKRSTPDIADALPLESVINIPSDDETEPERPAPSPSPSVASKDAAAEPPLAPDRPHTPEMSPFAASIASASPQAITTDGARMLVQQGPDAVSQPSMFAPPNNQTMSAFGGLHQALAPILLSSMMFQTPAHLYPNLAVPPALPQMYPPDMQTATIEEVDEVEDIIDISSDTTENETPFELPNAADTLPVMVDITDSSVPETPDVAPDAMDTAPYDPFVLKAGLLESPSKKSLALLAEQSMSLPFHTEEDQAVFVPRRVPKNNKAYVLVPPPPDYVKRLKNRDTFAGEQDNEIHHMQKEEALRKAVRLSGTRLRKRTCGWGGCSVDFNSGNALEEHVKSRHMGESDQSSRVYRCQWTLCGKTFDVDSYGEHVLQHVTGDLYCAYEDCDQRFKQPSALSKHHQVHELDEDRLRLPALPFSPDLPEPYSTLPETLPSYMSATRPIAREPISPSRHALLGPWVLWNIFGQVKHDYLIGRRPRLAVSKLKDDNSAEKGAHPAVVPIVGYDEYDFLDNMSNETPVVCDDLADPQGVSRLLHGGVPLTVNDEVGAGVDEIPLNPNPNRPAMAEAKKEPEPLTAISDIQMASPMQPIPVNAPPSHVSTSKVESYSMVPPPLFGGEDRA